jgi:methylenetetrahydrofolate dehydrogenase (NADP+) / methenyltetrahydrofolate cyclohydrolase
VVVGQIWDGGDVAQELLENVRQEVVRLQHEGRPPPTLAEIRVGEALSDERIQLLHADACRKAGVSYQAYTFPPYCSHQAILQTLANLNADATVNGITVDAQPPTHVREFTAAIAPEKDVDGLHPLHLGRFITNKRVCRYPRGANIVQLLKRAGLTLRGMHVICIGNASGLAGALAFLCLHENATVSAWKDPSRWPVHLLQSGDVLILDSDDLPPLSNAALKPGVVVVDARHRRDKWMQHQAGRVPEAISLLISVPGGMGPTTIAMRLISLVALYRASAITSCDS